MLTIFWMHKVRSIGLGKAFPNLNLFFKSQRKTVGSMNPMKDGSEEFMWGDKTSLRVEKIVSTGRKWMRPSILLVKKQLAIITSVEIPQELRRLENIAMFLQLRQSSVGLEHVVSCILQLISCHNLSTFKIMLRFMLRLLMLPLRKDRRFFL